MAAILGLLAAVTYGAADFVGGMATKRSNPFSVVVFSQVTGSALLLAALPFVASGRATVAALAWGARAGAGGGFGVVFLYRGLAEGRMSVVAPVTGVVAAISPVLVGLLRGERPGPVPLLGVVLALGAVALVSSAPHPDSDASAHRSGLLDALVAGLGFGVFFIGLDLAGDDTGLWPLVAARLGSLVLVAAFAVILRRPLLVEAPVRRSAAGAGVLDVAANLFYLLGTRAGLLSLVAVLTSMYPASTVVLARVVLDERLRRSQIAGLACAAVGVAMIAAG